MHKRLDEHTMIHTGGLSTFSPRAALKMRSFFNGAKVIDNYTVTNALGLDMRRSGCTDVLS